jgi:hypothetical protein
MQCDDTRVLKSFQNCNFALHSFSFHRIGQSIFFISFNRIFGLVTLVKANSDLSVSSLTNDATDLIVLKGTFCGLLRISLNLLTFWKDKLGWSLLRHICVTVEKVLSCSLAIWMSSVTIIRSRMCRHSSGLRSTPVVCFVQESDSVFTFRGTHAYPMCRTMLSVSLGLHRGSSCDICKTVLARSKLHNILMRRCWSCYRIIGHHVISTASICSIQIWRRLVELGVV